MKQETCITSSSMVISLVCVCQAPQAMSLCIGWRTLQPPTHLGCQGKLQDPSHLTSCERRKFCFTISHARTLVTAANDLLALDATIPQHQTHWPNLCLDHHSSVLAFSVAIADLINANEDEFSHYPTRPAELSP